MNGDTIRLRLLRRDADFGPSDDIEINPHDQTVIVNKGALTPVFTDLIRAAVTISGDPWLEARPGANTLTVTADIDAQEERHVVADQSTWLA